MRITVAICTWNRSPLLDKTLERLALAERPRGAQLEVVVVNNNCTDDTDAVIAKYTDRLPIVRVFEKTPGLSNARNAAIDHSSGDYILWTDDDVLVAADWIRAYESAFAKYPDAVFFGGPIDPWFDGTPPEWVTGAWARIQVAFATRELGSEDFKLDAQRLPFGANFALRTDVQRTVRYSPAHGRSQDGSVQSGEETAVLLRLIAEGKVGWYVGGARVKHWIPRARQTRAYLRAYYEGHGIQMINAGIPAGRFNVLGVPTWLWQQWLVGECSSLLLRLLNRNSRWGFRRADTSVYRGMIRGIRRARAKAPALTRPRVTPP